MHGNRGLSLNTTEKIEIYLLQALNETPRNIEQVTASLIVRVFFICRLANLKSFG